MRFEFATATRILFGAGCLRELGRQLADLVPETGRAVVVTGNDARRAEPLRLLLKTHGWTSATLTIANEPTVEDATRGAEFARREQATLVIGMGGGSVLDAGKAIAALAGNPSDPLDYLEVIGRGQPLDRPPLTYVAIPTTAGTGSEVTRNAVLTSMQHKVKVSLRSPHMLAKLALVDPELTYTVPPAVTAATGLDALTQLIEPFVCNRANPMTDALCREGIVRAARSLRCAWLNGHDAAAREDMSLAALFGGLALANAGLGAVHGFAGPIGGAFPSAPHGAVCAILLPQVMAAYVRALQRSGSACPALERYGEIARMVTGNCGAQIDDGIAWVGRLVDELHIPRLSAYGLEAGHVDVLVGKADAASSMKANPVVLPPDELRAILLAVM